MTRTCRMTEGGRKSSDSLLLIAFHIQKNTSNPHTASTCEAATVIKATTLSCLEPCVTSAADPADAHPRPSSLLSLPAAVVEGR